MKKLLFTFILLITSFSVIACSNDDDDRIISLKELPAISQAFLEKHFPEQTVTLAEKDDDGYEVVLNNKFKIDFSLSGDWDDINGYGQAIPKSILELLPTGIVSHVETNYPAETFITEINKETYGFEIELSNKLELKFKSDGTYIGIDK
ncbi:PepSY-like domain-containing protein [Dysgonomonas sp. ZJ709]|uniref:PepSY-like domain-containing protein n=1 Tax=Dysgonomonas sp. ZJ709 TaxID=2709797 RepID=UPI0013E9DDB9|nr:PepSY-like domain-containing protein [Dysgonomonas sp. ZJ709]